MDSNPQRPLAVVTGASSGIGYHLARCCATRGFDLVVAADRPLDDVADDFRIHGAHVTVVHADLASQPGVEDLCEAVGTRRCKHCWPMPGTAWARGSWRRTSARSGTSSTPTSPGPCIWYTVWRPACSRGKGRILITGSIAPADLV